MAVNPLNCDDGCFTFRMSIQALALARLPVVAVGSSAARVPTCAFLDARDCFAAGLLRLSAYAGHEEERRNTLLGFFDEDAGF